MTKTNFQQQETTFQHKKRGFRAHTKLFRANCFFGEVYFQKEQISEIK